MRQHDYGLPTPRDPETGKLEAVEHEYEWEGQDVTVKLVPPTLTQIQRYQDFGDDVDTERLEEVIDSHIEKPSLPAADMTLREINCYMEGIVDYGAGGGNDLAAEVRDELESRATAGNSS